MSEGATPSSELRVESFAPLVSPGQARKGVSFESRIAQLRALCEQHGHALPTAEHGSDLVRWASRQRTLYRQGSLPEAVVEELDAVHFVWDPLQAAWDARFEELEAFYRAHAHCNVPADGGPLGSWVAPQRHPNPNRTRNRNRNRDRDRNPHPHPHPHNRPRPGQVARQRRQYRQGSLRPERQEALAGVDFEWDPAAARWERSLAQYAGVRLKLRLRLRARDRVRVRVRVRWERSLAQYAAAR